MATPETQHAGSSETGSLRRVAVTGSTGLIGSALVESLRSDGYEVRRVVRSRPAPGSSDIGWDPTGGMLEAEKLDGLDAVVHLAGENLAQRWTDEAKRKIRRSRVEGTRLLAESLASLASPPRVLVSASGVGYYGDRGDERLDETSSPGNDFLAELVQDWEAATAPAASAGIRVVHLRSGVVLSPEGGALARMLPPFRLGLGGKLGDGTQWFSWISRDDEVAVIRFAMEHEELSGPINTLSPNPVTNAEFTETLGRVIGRPTVFTVPEFALNLLFGQMANDTLLASQRAFPRRLQEAGFRFRYPELEGALRAVL
jgi:uncharacterized protein (TIGR01777 family)